MTPVPLKHLLWPVTKIGIGTVFATWVIISAMLIFKLMMDWKHDDLVHAIATLVLMEIYFGAIIAAGVSLGSVLLIVPWLLSFGGLCRIGVPSRGAATLASGGMALVATALLILFGGNGRLAIPFLSWQFAPVPVGIAMGLGWKTFGQDKVAASA